MSGGAVLLGAVLVFVLVLAASILADWYVVPLVAVGMPISLVTGALLPGPDALPWWGASILGGTALAVGQIIAGWLGMDVLWAFAFALPIAFALQVANRLLIEQRPLTGPLARRFPRHGLGVARARVRADLGEGLTDDAERALVELEELRELRNQGEIDRPEFVRRQRDLLDRAAAGGYGGGSRSALR